MSLTPPPLKTSRTSKASFPPLLSPPSQLTPILPNSYVSPRHRAQKTLELLNLGCHDPYPWQDAPGNSVTPNPSPHKTDARVTVTDRIAEWDYGDYEGITSAEIRKLRAEQGLGPWDIWRDGCPGGESPEEIIARVDSLIAEIRE